MSAFSLKFKKLSEYATVPTKRPGDAGFDLTAVSFTYLTGMKELYGSHVIEYDTGIGVAIPDGYVGLLMPRSSISTRGASLANSVGVIDSSYRGPVKIRLRMEFDTPPYQIGERLAQLVVVPILEGEFEEVDDLPPTTRGAGSFGSSGR